MAAVALPTSQREGSMQQNLARDGQCRSVEGGGGGADRARVLAQECAKCNILLIASLAYREVV